ncbi:MAG: M23 family metallopeptidase [Bacteroidetes bacterium]|jgi:murein DD-endopeptidase MepM/ murein hydrolase activator NlpD|nr:M23 family metallopeptidase [Bacteroidota bacterium]MBT6686660.1 M23 family metallopeptidase [Bacteroidota bacterium]MBT7144098.1 M23 family metallopeptidase [Bacteroidota bacterium]MBT7492259.1 M23 family metallopeptidase [Bacteroidota bacterium]
MAKNKYHFDKDSLSYSKIELGIKQKIFKLFTYFTASVVMAVILVVVFLSYFNSPKEKQLKREINQLSLQYEILNKQAEQISVVLDDIQQRDDNIYRTIFESEPISSTIRKAGIGGINRYKKHQGYENSTIVIETAKKLDKIEKSLYVQSKSYDEVEHLVVNKEQMLSCIPAIMPISNKDLTRTSSGWGYRIHPVYKIRKFHYGMDFTAPKGTEVYVSGDGVVSDIVKSRWVGYGHKVIIDHGFGYKTLYAHLNSFNVKKGQKVKRGDVIAFVGNTGISTAPHLHYEVHKDGKKTNPQHYYFKDLTPEEYDRMIEISSSMNQTFD